MLLALLTDIHGNREALDACLAHAVEMGAGRYLFLGDYVGYGADPAYVVDVVSGYVRRGAVALIGNHDAAVDIPDPRMNLIAQAAIDWTREQLDQAQRAFLARLPLTHQEGERLFVHASAAAPHEWAYVTDQREASRSFRATPSRVIVCGHVHVPAIYCLARDGVIDDFTPVGGAPIALAPDRRWLAVLGAVGQPRDYNPAACYGLLDEERNELTFVRVPYDIDAAAQKILEAGLPPPLAARLRQGW
jgi:diadenosine tetraphosphatase ApaH/serine/threonine PP2A family protein phosphatase